MSIIFSVRRDFGALDVESLMKGKNESIQTWNDILNMSKNMKNSHRNGCYGLNAPKSHEKDNLHPLLSNFFIWSKIILADSLCLL